MRDGRCITTRMGRQRRRSWSILAMAMPTRCNSQNKKKETKMMPAVAAAAWSSAGHNDASLPRSMNTRIMFSNVSSTRCQRRSSVA